VLEYVGGESGVIIIAGLAVFSFFITRHMRSDKFKAALLNSGGLDSRLINAPVKVQPPERTKIT
jgi:hypothetical protein